MIRLESVSFSYLERMEVLHEVSLELVAGLSLLLGPNGCGKSTLLKIMAGVEHPSSGRISVAGHDLWKHEVAARSQLAYVPEHPDLSPFATVREILDLVCGLRGRPRSDGADALAWVGLDGLGGRTVRELSKGQRRRAALAAARIATPPCLLFDEPLEGMDRSFRQSLMQWIVQRREAGGTVVVVSHDLEVFADIADRAFTLTRGRIHAVEVLPKDDGQRRVVLEGLARASFTDHRRGCPGRGAGASFRL